MRPLLYSLVLVAALASVAQESADRPEDSLLNEYMDIGMVVEGVRTPYYDEDGRLQAELFGGRARIVGKGRAEVEHLRIDVYQDEAVFMTLYAPGCMTEMVEQDGSRVLQVHSDGDVLIEMQDVSIAGRGFFFSSDRNRFEILHDARVLVKPSARDMKGLEL